MSQITADTSSSVLRYVKETTLGTTPASALKVVRQTSNDLVRSQSYTTSQEIQSDRNIRDNILTDMEVTGSVPFELSFADFDDFFEAALFNTFSTAVAISATDIAAASTGNKYTSTTTNFTTANIVVGQWLKIAGFTNAANNGFAKVTSLTATELVISNLTLVNESATPTITMSGQRLRNGTTLQSFSLENEFTDITQFINFKGMCVNSMNLSFEVGNILNGTFDFIGMTSARATTTIGTGAHIASSTNDVMNAVSDISNIRENGSLLSTSGIYVLSASLLLENGLRGQKALGNLGNVGIGTGRCNVTGELQVYFKDGALYDKFINDTASSVDLRVTDGTNSYIFTIPKIKFTNGTVSVGGVDQDIVLPLAFQGIYDSTTACSIQIDKF